MARVDETVSASRPRQHHHQSPRGTQQPGPVAAVATDLCRLVARVVERLEARRRNAETALAAESRALAKAQRRHDRLRESTAAATESVERYVADLLSKSQVLTTTCRRQADLIAAMQSR